VRPLGKDGCREQRRLSAGSLSPSRGAVARCYTKPTVNFPQDADNDEGGAVWWAMRGRKPAFLRATAELLPLAELLTAGDPAGTTGIMLACAVGDVASVTAYLAADPAAKHAAPNDYGWTPCGAAAAFGQTEAVGVLLAAGAAVAPVGLEAFVRPLDLACGGGHHETVCALLAHAMHGTAAGGSAPYDLEAADDAGLTALLHAAAGGCERCIRAVAAEGGSLRAATATEQSALQLATAAGHTDAVAALIELTKAECDGGDFLGFCLVASLRVAARVPCAGDVAALLLAAGAGERLPEEGPLSTLVDTSLRSGAHEVALHLVCEYGRLGLHPLVLAQQLPLAAEQGATAVVAAIQRVWRRHAIDQAPLLLSDSDVWAAQQREGVELAAASGQWGAAAALLESGAACGDGLLALAAGAGAVGVVSAMLARRSAGRPGRFGQSALAAAMLEAAGSANGTAELVRLLAGASAPVVRTHDDGRTAGDGGPVGVHGAAGTLPLEPSCQFPLVAAARAGRLDVIGALLSLGAAEDVNSRTPEGASPLAEAAAGGHAAVVSALLAAGALPGAGVPTPLFHAAMSGDVTTVLALVTADGGAAIDTPGTRGMTPVRAAAGRGHSAVVVALLEAGCDAAAADERGVTPAIAAAVLAGDGATLDAVLRSGRAGDLTVPDRRGRGVIHGAASMGRSDLVRGLIDAGVKPCAPDASGLPPLVCAAGGGHLLTVRTLLGAGAGGAGAGLSAARSDALLAAAAGGHSAVVTELLHAGVERLLESGDDCAAALLSAMKCGDAAMVAELTQSLTYSSAAAAVEVSPGCSALQWAADRGDTAVVSVLVSSPEGRRWLHEDGGAALAQAAKRGHSDVVGLLLAEGGRNGATLPIGAAVLEAAVSGRHVGVLNVLVGAGAEVSARLRGDLLILASKSRVGNSTRLVRWLIRSLPPPDVEARGADGATPLFLAVQNSVHRVRVLLAAGAKTRVINGRSGQTALMAACAQSRNDAAARVLLASGRCGDPHQVDKWGNTEMGFACKAAGPATVAAMIRHQKSLDADRYLHHDDMRILVSRPAFPLYQSAVLPVAQRAIGGAGCDDMRSSVLSIASALGSEFALPALLAAGGENFLLSTGSDEPLLGALRRSTSGQAAVVMLRSDAVRGRLAASEDLRVLALCAACSVGTPTAVGVLIRAGAGPASVSAGRMGQVFASALSGQRAGRCLEALLADTPQGHIPMRLNSGEMLIEAAMRRGASARGSELGRSLGANRMLELLLRAGLDPNVNLSRTGRPLLHAVAAGNSCQTLLLLLAGADAGARGADGETAEDLAAKHGWTLRWRSASREWRWLSSRRLVTWRAASAGSGTRS